jgi:hypothetical protein
LEKHRYEGAAGRLDVRFILIHDGRIESRDYTQCVYSCGEIIRMLSGVGLETQALYGSIDKTPYQLGCRDLILVARRA